MFYMIPEILFLAVNIINHFLFTWVASPANLQLLSITCLFIASKVKEIMSPSNVHFLHCTGSTYTKNKILQMEQYVLKMLEWNLSYPNPIHFLQRVSKADRYDIKARTIAKYLIQTSCLEWRLLSALPSLLTTAAIWFAFLILNNENWVCFSVHVFSFTHYFNYLSQQTLSWHITHCTPRVNWSLLQILCLTMYWNQLSTNHFTKNTWVRNT